MPARLLHDLKGWLDAGLSFLYPEACQYCGREPAAAAEGFVCESCRGRVKWIRPPYCARCGLPFEGDLTTPFECANCREMELYFVQARSVVAVQGVVLDIIHRYKYQRALWFEPFLAALLVQAAAEALRQGPWGLIVPVPLHPIKKSEREFNQSERLARHLSRATQVPLETRGLKRVAPTRTQALLSRTERASNVRRAFAVNGKGCFQAKHVVLVDDVLTTGATTSACAKVLRDAGAAQVCVWTVARGLLN